MNMLRVSGAAGLGMILCLGVTVFAQPASQPATRPVLTEADVAAIVQRTLSDLRVTDSQLYAPRGVRWTQPTMGYIEPGSVAQQASCVLQIEVNRDFGPPATEAGTAAAILNTSLIHDSVAGKVLKLNPEQRNALVVISASQTNERFLRLEVVRKKGDVAYAPDAANRMLWGLCDALQDALEQSARSQKEFLKHRNVEIERELAAAKARLAEVRAKLRECRAATSGISSAYGDPQSALANVRSQKQSTEAELNRHRTRLKQMEPSGGAITAEWESIVALRQGRVDELLKQKEAANAAEIAEAQVKLAEAKAQLANAKQSALEAAARAGRSYDTSSIRTQIAECELRLKTYDEQLAKLEDPKYMEMFEQIPELQSQEQQLRSHIQNVSSRSAASARIEQSPVTWLQVTVLGDSGGRRARPPSTQP